MTEFQDILFDEIEGSAGTVGVITLNRQQALNALNFEMFVHLGKYLRQWASDPQVKAVIVKAASGRAFCAGGDIREVYHQGRKDHKLSCRFFANEYRINHLIHHYPKPYIALLDGITMGGGVGISIHGSHVLATENLRFAMPETSIGFFTDIGGSYFLSRLPSEMGTYLGLTGESINAQDCLQLGLAQHLIASDDIESLINEIVASADNEMPTLDRVINSYALMTKIQANSQMTSSLFANQLQIAECFAENTIEAIMQKLDRRDDEWGQKTLITLRAKSPTSLKMVLELLRRGRQLDFDDCMRLEYHLACHFLKSHDFYEGVRAQVIDKDKNPQWQPASLSDVTDMQVAKFFQPYYGDELEFDGLIINY